MTITLTVEISNTPVKNFAELVKEVYQIALGIGRQILKTILEQVDDELVANRDKGRFRCKGFQKTCIKTILGEVEYKRRVYIDQTAVESNRCVHLLDEELELQKVGLLSSDICHLAATAITETTYRGTSKLISEATGLSISPQGVWNMIQKIGTAQTKLVERHTELAKKNASLGQIKTELLYEEDDGIWLKLQGRDRKEYGTSKEMKVGIAYDGVRYTKTKSGKRKTLDSKVAYANFETAGNFRTHKEGLVASRYSIDGITMRIHNGDGASWIRTKNGENNIDVLDEYHRNRKITECVNDSEFAKLLREHLFNKDIDMFLTCLEAQINSMTDSIEIEKLKQLQQYFTENKQSLLSYWDRGIEIPQTRDPENIHHASLGSMESNIFTLIGNRMKGRRACWTIDGANNLAILLCQKHTVGFEQLFSNLPLLPKEEPEWVDTLPVFGASKVPEKEGHGYELTHRLSISNTSGWLSVFLKELANSNNF